MKLTTQSAIFIGIIIGLISLYISTNILSLGMIILMLTILFPLLIVNLIKEY